MRKISLRFLVLFISCLLLSPIYAHAKYSRIIVFGDSLSDVGNNTWVQPDAAIPYAPIGAPITNNEAGKRGNLWINDLVQTGYPALVQSHQVISSRLGQQTVPNPQLSVSYAYASATTMNVYTDDDGIINPGCTTPGKTAANICVPGLLKQVDLYLHAEPVDPQALYMIWIGGNDIFNNVGALMSLGKGFGQLKNMSWQPTHNILRAVNQLVKKGVPSQNIIVLNLPDITKTPGARKLTQDKFLPTQVIRSIISLFNTDLAMQIYAHNFIHQNHVLLIDVAPLLTDIYQNRQQGKIFFSDVDHECVLDKTAFAEDCRAYLFYNAKHPTTQTSTVIASYVLAKLNKELA